MTRNFAIRSCSIAQIVSGLNISVGSDISSFEEDSVNRSKAFVLHGLRCELQCQMLPTAFLFSRAISHPSLMKAKRDRFAIRKFKASQSARWRSMETSPLDAPPYSKLD